MSVAMLYVSTCEEDVFFATVICKTMQRTLLMSDDEISLSYACAARLKFILILS